MSYLLYYKVKKTTKIVIERERSKKQSKAQSKEQSKASLIKNSGCCGAVSDAWVPSYQSLMVTQLLDSSSSDESDSLDSSEVKACR
jgi:hypothetical protein